ncbi:MAG: hypothetical protein K2K69_07070 [Muribaculaceae bacterium]|nr:hypothetical protein [Muribaculaceae bacterium]
MNRYERYLADYRAEKANTGELLALTGEELAHSIARLAEADQAELTQAAVYCLEVALDHCRELCRDAMPDQAAASLIGLLFMLLHRKVNPEALPALYCRALTEVVFTSFAAAQKAQSEGDAYAREHWTAIVLQQVALAAATLRFLAPTEGVNPDQCAKILEIADKDASVPTTWHSAPITPRSAIDILGDSTSRLLALGLLD